MSLSIFNMVAFGRLTQNWLHYEVTVLTSVLSSGLNTRVSGCLFSASCNYSLFAKLAPD